MSWCFVISTGQLSLDGQPAATGYAGRGTGKNNPECCSAPMGSLGAGNFGPLPAGKYTIGPAYDDPHRGQYTMHLNPDAETRMHGRSGFLIHADSVAEPGEASEGCIVPVAGVHGESGLEIRARIAASPDRDLEVQG
ncbi:MAG TPA: tlde1 domain-containing protein [Bryobacteraceae bacterium]|nr:tlde1 domain-containing protein [Bryobacteraceae bacterium]